MISSPDGLIVVTCETSVKECFHLFPLLVLEPPNATGYFLVGVMSTRSPWMVGPAANRGGFGGWRRAGPWRSGARYSRVCGAATAKAGEHVRVRGDRTRDIFATPTLTLPPQGGG